MRYMGLNYEQINDNLIGKKYEFKGNNRYDDDSRICYKWEYKPKTFVRSKWYILELRTIYSESITDEFQKYIDYTTFSNDNYVLLKNQFVQNGFKKSASETSKDDEGNSIIQSIYIKGTYELTITTFVDGQYCFSLFKWSTK